MAHADYHCCAICDCKLDYGGWDATTKERICEDCLLKLQELGLRIVTVGQLFEWIRHEDREILRDKLKKLGFRKCYYGNEVDDAVSERDIKFNVERAVR